MKLYFVTCNDNKVREVKKIAPESIEIEKLPIDYPELRSDYPEEIAELAAKQLADSLNKPVFVEDSGIFIKAIGGLPGTCSAYMYKRIGLKGLLKLMRGEKDRSAMYISAVAYCKPKKKPVVFLGTEKGKIALRQKGKYGFAHDAIFIPKGSSKTYAQMPDVEDVKKFRKEAFTKLLQYLKKE